MAQYEPHHEIPLAAFGLGVASYGVVNFFQAGSFGVAGLIAMLASTIAVLITVRHWRFG